MIKICKNFTPQVDSKRSSINIKNKEDSSRILSILQELEVTLNEPINKAFDPYFHSLCEELIEYVREAGLKVRARDHIYFTELVKGVQYWHLYREIEQAEESFEDEEFSPFASIEDDYFSQPRDEYFLEKVGFE